MLQEVWAQWKQSKNHPKARRRRKFFHFGLGKGLSHTPPMGGGVGPDPEGGTTFSGILSGGRAGSL